MSEDLKILQYDDFIKLFMEELEENYWKPLSNLLKDNPKLIPSFTAFLLNPERIVFYIGKTHLAVEYYGNESTVELTRPESINITLFDHSQSDKDLFYHITGFNYESTAFDIKLPLPNFTDDLILPTNAGADKLFELGWDFTAQTSLVSFNSPSFEIPINEFCRIVNGRFYDADEKGLKTRHIKWMDFIPLSYNEEHPDHDVFGISFKFLKDVVTFDANYSYQLPPKNDFKYSKLPQINRFIELTGNSNSSEPQITKFLELEPNRFILSMGFLAKEIHSQLICEWQSEENRPAIQPDFFVVKSNGYADIVEFKLPDLKSKTVVGRTNRETFSAEINSYISQTRQYRSYFEDPNNRRWVEENHGIRVRYPKRTLVVGRRWDFSSEEWKEIINDYADLEIITFDDLIDGVTTQFYL